MTQEDKELLVKDLCERLQYKVKVTTTNPAVEFGIITGISIKNKITIGTKHADIVFDCTEVKPFLRPMSSMTDEELIEYGDMCYFILEYISTNQQYYFNELYDWLNKHHFDYRGLINKGLAIAVTKENNPYKE